MTPEQRRAAWVRENAVEPEGAPEAPSADELAAVEKERDEYIAALQRLKASSSELERYSTEFFWSLLHQDRGQQTNSSSKVKLAS